ncbi:MAG: Dabb family protein [Muribaculaceae bacterium]|nr:Dabb family protein [Muribaculaceae bacterium]
MVKHIVMFRLAGEDAERQAMAERFKAALEALPATVEGLTSIEVGLNDGPAAGNWHIVLTAVCPDYEALEAYSAHPAHLACVAIIKPAIEARACVDYTF